MLWAVTLSRPDVLNNGDVFDGPDVIECPEVRSADVLVGQRRIQWPDDAIDRLPRRSPAGPCRHAQE
jgi:hypothetical protein